MTEERFTTIQALARRWRTSSSHVRGLIARGQLRAVKVGAKLRVSESAVRDFETWNAVTPSHLDYCDRRPAA